MKKETLMILLCFVFLGSFAQDFRVGIRFNPVNSYYYLDEGTNANTNYVDQFKNEERYDSLTVGLFCEKYFKEKSMFLRADFSYASLNMGYVDDETSTGNDGSYVTNYSQNQKQQYFKLNLGIGNRIAINKLMFSFGGYIPLTYLPKGSITRNVEDYEDWVLSSKTTCKGTFSQTLMYGIGCFAGIHTIVFKHISLGADFSYQIEYLSQKLDWHGETWYYSGTPYMTYTDEKIRYKNYFTSRLMPSINIAYAFDCRKKSEPQLKQ